MLRYFSDTDDLACHIFFRQTYSTTLAELTSLEELMRTMMVEEAIHPDIIAKLWQAYSVFCLV